jgi:hypothetical protein
MSEQAVSGGKGFVRYLKPGSIHPALHERCPDCRADGCYPVFVTPLVYGEPWPGETWEHDARGAVTIVAPTEREEVRVRDREGVDWLVPRTLLTRIPPTREVSVTVSSPERIIFRTVTVPADMTDDEVRRRVVGALEVDSKD